MTTLPNLTQFVTLVSKGGVPVTLADAFGNPYPTTGFGSLVFSENPTLNGPVFDNASVSVDAIGPLPPTSPYPGQLWFYTDDSAGGGTLYVFYDDGNSQQWCPASPNLSSIGPASGDLTGNYPGPTIKPSVQLTGNPTAPTPLPGDSDTSIATTAFVNASLSYIYAGQFGVTVGTTADQSVALQAAINAAEAQKLKLVLPAGYIRIDNTIFLGRTDPVWVEGQQPHAFTSFTGNQADDVTCLYCANLPSNVPAVQIMTTDTGAAPTRDGVTLKNMTIYRPTDSLPGAGDRGVLISSCVKPLLEDLAIRGFDVGLHCSINADGTRNTVYGNFRNVRIDHSGNYACLIESAIDCLFDHCWFGGATLATMAITLPSIIGGGNTVSNGNYWEHCTFIASTGTTPVNAVRVDCGFWNTFDNCAMEAATAELFCADFTAAGNNSGHAVDRTDVVLMNCWLNNGVTANTGLMKLKDVNFQIIGGHGSGLPQTDAAIKVDNSFFGSTTFQSCIVGMQIQYSAVAGINVIRSDSLRIMGCSMRDYSATALPCVVLGAAVGRCAVIGNKFDTTHARGFTDANETIGGGSIFRDNILPGNTSSDQWSSPKAINGPVLAFAGQTPRISEYGLSQAGASRLYARYTADNGGIFHYFYKTRQTVPGGTRAAVSAADGVSMRRFYADDGTADQEVVREVVNVDSSGSFIGGSWEILTKANTTGTLTSRLKVDNLGVTTLTGSLIGTTGYFSSLTVASPTLVNFSALGVTNITPVEQIGSAAVGTSFSIQRWAASPNGPVINMSLSRNATVGTQAAVTLNDIMGVLNWNGSDGTGFMEAAYIRSIVDGSVAAGSVPGALVFSTTTLAGTSATEKMRISNAGAMTLTGSLGRGAPVVKTADFTVATTENWLANNKAAATCTVTLPAAATSIGREIMIVNYQAFTVVSASANVIPTAGTAAATAILPATAGASVTLVSDGTAWRSF